MMDCGEFYKMLGERGVDFFAGVPDSLLKHFCAYVDEHCPPGRHIITANEGNAVALAAGYHLATGKIAAVYMQNSGLGNCVNPLTSLTDPEVYSIPLLLIIGWRGEPGAQDEPQHVKQGRVTGDQLNVLEIPFWVLDADSDPDGIINKAFDSITRRSAPAALLIRKGTFASYSGGAGRQAEMSSLKREAALAVILDMVDSDDLIVSTTGKTSRELFELRTQRNERHGDFLTVGSMGHTSSIALGAALGAPGRRVICLDGDGSALMHFGALPVIGNAKPENLVYVLLNNASHESVGGQRTVAGQMDFSAISKACGFKGYSRVENAQELTECWRAIERGKGPYMLEVRIAVGAREDLGRPTSSPLENKKSFMEVARG